MLEGQKRTWQFRLKEVRRKQNKNLHERFVASSIVEWSFKAQGLCLHSIKNEWDRVPKPYTYP